MSDKIWNKIVECSNLYINSPEKKIQCLWENIFAELLGYSRLDGDIDSFRSMQIGSSERIITDIIIRNNENDLFIVELKKHNISYCGEKQLLSYLKLLHNDIGILISDKIYIIDYEYNKNDNEQIKIEIEFTANNPDGIKFVELFSKKNFNKEKIKEFIYAKNKFIKNVNEIKSKITQNILLDLLKQKLSLEYSDEEIEHAISLFDINIYDKSIEKLVETYLQKENNKTHEHIEPIKIDIMPATKLEKFINAVKELYPSLSNGYIKAYQEIFTDENGEIYDYDKLYKLLITQYSSNRPPAPSWFAQKISEIITPEKRALVGIKNNSSIYQEIVFFVQQYQEEHNIKKIPISKVKSFCTNSRMVTENKFKKWLENLIEEFINASSHEWLICKNQMYVWLEYNYNYDNTGM